MGWDIYLFPKHKGETIKEALQSFHGYWFDEEHTRPALETNRGFVDERNILSKTYEYDEVNEYPTSRAYIWHDYEILQILGWVCTHDSLVGADYLRTVWLSPKTMEELCSRLKRVYSLLPEAIQEELKKESPKWGDLDIPETVHYEIFHHFPSQGASRFSTLKFCHSAYNLWSKFENYVRTTDTTDNDGYIFWWY